MSVHESRALPKLDLRYQGDKGLLLVILALLAWGLIMVASASIDHSRIRHGITWYFLARQGAYMLLALTAMALVYRLPMQLLEKLAPLVLVASLLLLVVVLLPGIGVNRNGSQRWLNFGVFMVQVSEFAKIGILFYLASYCARHRNTLKVSLNRMAVPLVVLAIAAVLLFREPDFGAAAVLVATSLVLLFLAGAPLWPFAVLLALVVMAMAGVAVMEDYRLDRIQSFANPWSDPFGRGYQLTMALIAVGRGGLMGVGLGNSMQKQDYLPEAHTDFIFSVLAEEMGFIGIALLLCLFGWLVWKVFSIARQAMLGGRYFAANLAYALGTLLAIQVAINLGVNMGLLPTKGLTLPFFSYGGSSLLACGIISGLLLRIAGEEKALRVSAEVFDTAPLAAKTSRKTKGRAEPALGELDDADPLLDDDLFRDVDFTVEARR